MLRMLCNNNVADFSKWTAVFDSHVGTHISPDAATAGKASGVIEGNYWFLNDA